jgi:hypothetical protein
LRKNDAAMVAGSERNDVSQRGRTRHGACPFLADFVAKVGCNRLGP